jgi:Icc-related predicted phosphoesterase
MKLLWTTDIHLDHLKLPRIQEFCRNLLKPQNPDAIVITGDLSNSKMLFHHLLVLEKEMDPVPVFFVLGNHDYYDGSIKDIRVILKERYSYTESDKKELSKGAYWLGSSGIIPLVDSTALIGHDGWYDGGYANWFKSKLGMLDYEVIKELDSNSCPVKELRFDALQKIAWESANYIKENMVKAFNEGYKTLYIATHIPPFRESSTYLGKISDDDWMPHFSSKIMGDILLEVMPQYPENNVIVLCGHSHGKAYHKPLENLEVHTGYASYGEPSIAKTFLL